VGSDIVYGIPLAELLAKTIAKLLTPTGIFYGVMQSNRQVFLFMLNLILKGVEEIQLMLQDLGLVVESTFPPDEYITDFCHQNIWTFIKCHY
jgi:hypothetical protein